MVIKSFWHEYGVVGGESKGFKWLSVTMKIPRPLSLFLFWWWRLKWNLSWMWFWTKDETRERIRLEYTQKVADDFVEWLWDQRDASGLPKSIRLVDINTVKENLGHKIANAYLELK